MFDPSLTCSGLSVPHRGFEKYAESAEAWSGPAGDIKHLHEFVTWSEPTHIEFAEYPWLRDISPILVNTTRAIGRVGMLEQRDVVVVISAFSSVTAALKEHVSREAAGDRGEKLAVDLSKFCRKERERFEADVRSLDAVAPDGMRIVTTAESRPLKAPSPGHSVEAVLLKVHGRDVRVGRNFDLKVESIDVDFAAIADCVTETFNIFKPYTSVVAEKAVAGGFAAA